VPLISAGSLPRTSRGTQIVDWSLVTLDHRETAVKTEDEAVMVNDESETTRRAGTRKVKPLWIYQSKRK